MFDVLCKDTRYTASMWEVQVNGLTSHLTHRITAEMWILNLVLWPEKLRVCVRLNYNKLQDKFWIFKPVWIRDSLSIWCPQFCFTAISSSTSQLVSVFAEFRFS